MPHRTAARRETMDRITRTAFHVLPLLRKKLMKTDRLQGEYGISLSHIQVLAVLEQEDTMSVTAISHALCVAKPNVTPLIDKLIKEGLVERKRNELDRRVVNVLLLPKGREKLHTVYAALVSDTLVRMGDQLIEKDMLELERALNMIGKVLSEANLPTHPEPLPRRSNARKSNKKAPLSATRIRTAQPSAK